jgi:hypothetical protein
MIYTEPATIDISPKIMLIFKIVLTRLIAIEEWSCHIRIIDTPIKQSATSTMYKNAE